MNIEALAEKYADERISVVDLPGGVDQTMVYGLYKAQAHDVLTVLARDLDPTTTDAPQPLNEG